MPVELLAPIKEMKAGFDTNIESIINSMESSIPQLPGMEGAMGAFATPPQLPGFPQLPGMEGSKSTESTRNQSHERRENIQTDRGYAPPLSGKPRFEKSY